MTLTSTFLWLGLLASLGFGLAGLSVQHLQASTFQENHQQALQLARSAVALTLGRLAQNPQYGKAPSSEVLTVNGQQEGAVGLATFNTTLAAEQRLPYCFNNLEGTEARATGEGRQVPANAALVCAVGRCGGVESRIEAVLAVPPFPFALASGGPIDARGGVVVASIPRTLTEPLGADDKLLPGHLFTNDSSNEAVFLGPGTNITGDAGAVGRVEVAQTGTVRVQGRIQNGAAARKMPQVSIQTYDPSSGGGFTALEQPTLRGSAPLTGSFRRQGDLTVNQGLNLDGGTLYVHGNLTVHGGISGKGRIVATGNVTVDGQSEFRSGSGLAVLAGGDLTLSGSGPAGSYFQGLLYTESRLQADKVTLVGSLLSRGTGEVKLEETRVIHPLAQASPEPFRTFNAASFPLVKPLKSPFTRDLAHVTYIDTPQGVEMHVRWEFPYNTGPIIGSVSYRLPGDLNAIMGDLKARLNTANLRPPNDDSSGIAPFIVDLRRQIEGVIGGGGGSTLGAPGTLEPSQFLQLADKIQVVQWKEQ